MYISLHAINRFRERVLEGRGDVTDWDISDTIRFARHGAFYAYLTQKGPDDPRKVWRFVFEGEHEGRRFYVVTNQAGDVAKTILTPAMLARWTTFAVAQRIPQAHRPSPFPTRSWRVLYLEAQ